VAVTVDPSGLRLTTRFAYNAQDQLISSVAADGVLTAYAYDALGRKTTQTVDPAGLNLSTRYSYDLQGRLARVVDPAGQATRYVYDKDGRLHYEVDPADGLTEHRYDALGNRVQSIRYADKQTGVQTVDAGNGLITTTVSAVSVNAAGDQLTQFTYDAMGRKSSQTVDPSGLKLTTRYSYDVNGHLARVTDPSGRQTRFVYDALGRLRFELDAANGLTEYRYDAAGHRVQTLQYADPQTGMVTTDIGNGLIQNRQGTPSANPQKDRITTDTFDAAGRRTLSRDAANVLTSYEYDGMGRVTSRRVNAAGAAPGAPDRLLYDRAGRLRYEVDAQGKTVEHLYDAAGRRIETIEYATPQDLSALDVAPGTLVMNGAGTPASNWFIYNDVGDGSTIQRVTDAATGRPAIALSGRAGFQLGTGAAPEWTSQGSVISWDMKFSSYFGLCIKVNTTQGVRYISYEPGTGAPTLYRASRDETYAIYKLGNDATDGQWHSYTRDLRADLAALDPEAEILSVQSFLIGSNGGPGGEGLIGDVKLSTTSQELLRSNAAYTQFANRSLKASAADRRTRHVYDAAGRLRFDVDAAGYATEYQYNDAGQLTETLKHTKPLDAVNFSRGTQPGEWSIYEATSSGATVSSVFDEDRKQTVTRLAGNGTRSFFAIFGPKGSWQAQGTQLSWDMKFSEDFYVTVCLETDQGLRYLQYTPQDAKPSDSSPFGLGKQAADGQWHRYTRDLQADLARAFPGAKFQAVKHFEIRGSGRVTDISLRSTVNEVAAETAESLRIDFSNSEAQKQFHYNKAGEWSPDGGMLLKSFPEAGGSWAAMDKYDWYKPGTPIRVGIKPRDLQGSLHVMIHGGNEGSPYVYQRLGIVMLSDGRAIVQVANAKGEWRSVDLGNYQPGTTYTIEFEAGAKGGTVYMHAEGSPRESGWSYTVKDEYSWAGFGIGFAVARDPSQTFSSTAELHYVEIGTSPAPVESRQVNDKLGRPIYTIDATGAVTQIEYDSASRVVARRRYANAIGLVDLAQGQVLTAAQVVARLRPQAALDQVEYFAYDAAGRTRFAINGLGEVSEYRYDAAGGLAHTLRYEMPLALGAQAPSLSTLEQAVPGLGEPRVYSQVLDEAGRVRYSVDPLGIVTENRYDNLGQLSERKVWDTALSSTGAQRASKVLLASDVASALKPSAADRVTRYVFGANGTLRYEQDPLGAVTERRYDVRGRVIEVIRYAKPLSTGLALTEQSFQGMLVSTPAQDLRTRSVYDTAGRLRYTVDAQGNVQEMRYDGLGRMVHAIDWDVRIDPSRLDDGSSDAAVAALLPASAGQASETVYGYDALDRQLFSLDAEGGLVEQVFDALGRVVQRIAYAKPATDAGKLSAARQQPSVAALRGLIQASPELDRVERRSYDSVGHLLRQVDAEGGVTAFAYDTFGYMTEQVQRARALSAEQMAALPVVLRSEDLDVVVSESDADRRTSFRYDQANRLRFTIDAYGGVTEQRYLGLETRTVRYKKAIADRSSLPEATPSEDLSSSVFVDLAGRLERAVDAAGVLTRYQYNSLGQLTLERLAEGLAESTTTTYVYDAAGRLKAKTMASGTAAASTVGYEYNALGQLVTETEARGMALANEDSAWAQAERQAQGLPVKATDMTAAQKLALLAKYSATYGYDKAGRRTSTTNAAGSTTTTRYNAFGRASAVVDPLGNTGYFYYDKLGRVTLQVDPEGYATRMNYAVTDGQVTSVRRYCTKVSAVEGVPPTTIEHANDAVEAKVYDRLGRLTLATDASSATESTLYGLDGNRFDRSVTNKLGGTAQYRYDRAGRLLTETLPLQALNVAGSASVPIVTRYEYDSFGNRKRAIEAEGSKDQRVTQYRYDAMGRITEQIGTAYQAYDPISRTVSTVTPVKATRWDALGREVETVERGNWVNGAVSGGKRTLRYWDAAGRDWLQISADGAAVSRSYDAAGNKIIETAWATTVSLPGTAGATPPVLVADVANDRVTRFTYDAVGRQVSMAREGVVSWETTAGALAKDIALQVNGPALAVLEQRAYDANGNVVRLTDGRGNSTYTYYDKIGRAVLRVDAAGYATAWDYKDFLSTASTEVRYGVALARYAAQNNLSAPLSERDPSSLRAALSGVVRPDPDRVTEFQLDRMGRVLERRVKSVVYQVTSASTGSVSAGAADAVTSYVLDGMGHAKQVKERTQGDDQSNVVLVTDIEYDKLGRETVRKMPGFQDWQGNWGRPIVEVQYNALGLVERVIRRSGETSNPAEDRVTVNQYSANGDLIRSTDAEGQVTEYAIDALGQVGRKRLVAVKASNGSTRDLETFYQYDAMGRQTMQVDQDTGEQRRTAYNAFGELTRKGLGASWQEFIDYDRRGLVQRSNSGDGVTKIYFYDLSGNTTRQIKWAGSGADLGQRAILASSSDTTLAHSFSVYDKRNQLVRTVEPDMSFLQSQATLGQAFGQKLSDMLGGINAIDTSDGRYGPLLPSYPGGYGGIEVEASSGSTAMEQFQSSAVSISAPVTLPAASGTKPAATALPVLSFPPLSWGGKSGEIPNTVKLSYLPPLPLGSNLPAGRYVYVDANGAEVASINKTGDTAYLKVESSTVALEAYRPATPYKLRLKYQVEAGTQIELGTVAISTTVTYYNSSGMGAPTRWVMDYAYTPTAASNLHFNSSYPSGYTWVVADADTGASLGGILSPVSPNYWTIKGINATAGQKVRVMLYSPSGRLEYNKKLTVQVGSGAMYFTDPVDLAGGGDFGTKGLATDTLAFYSKGAPATLYVREAGSTGDFRTVGPGVTVASMGLQAGKRYEFVAGFGGSYSLGRFSVNAGGQITTDGTDEGMLAAVDVTGDRAVSFQLGLNYANATVRIKFAPGDLTCSAVADANGKVSWKLDSDLKSLGVNPFTTTVSGFELWINQGPQLVGHASGQLTLGRNTGVSMDAQTYQKPVAELSLPPGMTLFNGMKMVDASTGEISTLWTSLAKGAPLKLDLSAWREKATAPGRNPVVLQLSTQELINGVDTRYSCKLTVSDKGVVTVSQVTSTRMNTKAQLNVAGNLTVLKVGSSEADARNAAGNYAGTSAVTGSSGAYNWDVSDLISRGARSYTYYYESRSPSTGELVGRGIGSLTVNSDGSVSIASGAADIRPLVVRFTPDAGSVSLKLEMNGSQLGPFALSGGMYEYTFPPTVAKPSAWTCKFTSYDGPGGTGRIVSKGSVAVTIDADGNITVGSPTRDTPPTTLLLKGPPNERIAKMQLLLKPLAGGAALSPVTINGVWNESLSCTVFSYAWDPLVNPPPAAGSYDYDMRLQNADGSTYLNALREPLDIRGVATINSPSSTQTVIKGPVGRSDVNGLVVELTDKIPDPSKPAKSPVRIAVKGVWSSSQNCMLFTWDASSLPAGAYRYALSYYIEGGGLYTPPVGTSIEQGGEITRGTESTFLMQFKQYVQTFKVDAQVNHLQTYNAFGEIATEFDDRVQQRMRDMLLYYKQQFPEDASIQGATVQESAALTRSVYNNLGQLIEKYDPQTWETTAQGVRRRILPVTRYGYDLLGRLNTSTNANGFMRKQAFAGAGNQMLAAQWDEESGRKLYAYDVFGDMRRQTNALDAVTLYGYDRMDRLVKTERVNVTRIQNFTGGADGEAVASTLTDLYSYDGRGLRLSHTDALQQRSTVDYDGLGRVVRTVSAAGATVSYLYEYREAGASDGITGLGGASISGYKRTTTDADGSTVIDKMDALGRTTWHKDKGGRRYSYDYDLGGRLKAQSSVDANGQALQNIAYDYYANGMIKAARDLKMRSMSSYGYDNAGNRIYEAYGGLARDDLSMNGYYQNAAITYDELNRMARVKDNSIDLRYEYDAVGNRRAAITLYMDPLTQGLRRRDDLWYTYDKANRFLITKGSLGQAGVVQGQDGVVIEYDAEGQRKSASYWATIDGVKSLYSDSYQYSNDGYLQQTVTVGAGKTQTSTRRVDAVGRTLNYIESNAGGLLRNDRQVFDADNRLQSMVDKDGGTTDYVYFLDSGMSTVEQAGLSSGRGQLAKTVFTPKKPDDTTVTTSYTYEYWDDAKQTSIVKTAVNVNAPNWSPGTSKFKYDANGFLSLAQDVTGGRTKQYINNATGLVLRRDESSPDGLFQQYYFYATGRRVGDIGTDPRERTRVSYAEQLARDALTPAQQQAQYKNVRPTTSVDFDQNYEPINASYPGAAAQSYTVREGDTLSSVALAVWGDAAMWYLIGDANGLTLSDKLIAGQVLVIPNKVSNIHNNANTFRPYSPGEAIGHIDPTLPDPPPPPQPQGRGCGGLGTLLMIAVAVAVTIYSAGALTAGVSGGFSATMSAGASALAGGGSIAAGSIAASMGATSVTLGTAVAVGAAASAVGSIASQAVGLAIGQIDSFSWSAVGQAALGGGITAGVGAGLDKLGYLTGGGTLATAGRAAIGSGVNMALHGNWNWRTVMVSAVSAGVGRELGGSGADFGSMLTRGLATGVTATALTGGNRRSYETMFMSSLGAAMGSAIGDSFASSGGVDWRNAPDESAAESARLERSGNRYAGGQEWATDLAARRGGAPVAWPRSSSQPSEDLLGLGDLDAFDATPASIRLGANRWIDAGGTIRNGRVEMGALVERGLYQNTDGDWLQAASTGIAPVGNIDSSNYMLADLPSAYQSKHGAVRAAWDQAGNGFMHVPQANGSYLLLSPPDGYSVPSLASFQLRAAGRGVVDTLAEIPAGLADTALAIGDGYRMTWDALSGGPGIQPWSNLARASLAGQITTSSVLGGIVNMSPVGVLGNAASGDYYAAGRSLGGTGVGLVSGPVGSRIVSSLNKLPVLGADVGSGIRVGAQWLGTGVAARLDAYMERVGGVMYAAPAGGVALGSPVAGEVAAPGGLYIPRAANGAPIPLAQRAVPGVGDVPLPLPEANGAPHSVLGGKLASDGLTLYRQTATFPGGTWPPLGEVDVPWGRVDWTDHGYLPGPPHPSPHIHEFNFDPVQKQWKIGPAKPFWGH